MNSIKRVVLDELKVRKLTNKQGTSVRDLSVELGHTQSYLTQHFSGNIKYLSKADGMYLCQLLGCELKDIELNPHTSSDLASNTDAKAFDDKILTEILMELKQANRALHELTEIKSDITDIKVYTSQMNARIKMIRNELCPKPVPLTAGKDND